MKQHPCTLGFVGKSLPPGRHWLEVTPQVPFKGDKLVIPKEQGEGFRILDLVVGQQHQLSASAGVPAWCFRPKNGISLALDKSILGQQIRILVENVTSAPQTFSAGIVGTGDYPDDQDKELLMQVPSVPPNPTPEAKGLSGFPSFLVLRGKIPAKTHDYVAACPQIPFRGQRLSIDPRVGEHFDIEDIKVGSWSVPSGYAPCSASHFPPLLSKEEVAAHEKGLLSRMPICQIGQHVVVMVHNKSDEERELEVLIWGESIP